MRPSKEIRRYSEIRNTYVEAEGIFQIVHLDGYKTMDDNEDGTLIARVVATKNATGIHHVTLYSDNSDRLDAGVQESLAEVYAMLHELFDDEGDA